MTQLLTYTCENGVARITLDDGKVNVMSAEMLGAIDAALTRAQGDNAIVVLRSARKGIFSAGFDLKVFAANDTDGSFRMVNAGAELALRLLDFPLPTIGVLEGHAYPMGTFLLLGCDVRLAADGPHRMGLNEVAIGITPPAFAIELARSRLHPAWLSRTVTLGEMYEPKDAVTAGFVDRIVRPADMEEALAATIASLEALHLPSHAAAKKRLRQPAIAAIRAAIDADLTPAAYAARTLTPSSVVLPKAKASEAA